jgi:hypothetical protein
MKRLARILWKVTAVGSLLLCLAMIALWVRSYWVSDALLWRRAVTPGDQTWYGRVELQKSIYTWRGGLHYSTNDMTLLPEPETLHYESGPVERAADPLRPTVWQFCGFAHFHFGGGSYATPETDEHRIPLYAPALLTALLPAIRLAACLRDARRPPGTCAHCGYDLRATPDRCPECGTAPTTNAPRPGGAGG